MEKEYECYEEEVQPYRKTDYKPIIYITNRLISEVVSYLQFQSDKMKIKYNTNKCKYNVMEIILKHTYVDTMTTKYMITL